MKKETQQIKQAIKMAKQEIEEWTKFLKIAEERLAKLPPAIN